jgi:ribokinase
MNTRRITIFGSYNASVFFKGERLPGPGETVIADQFYEGPGGKGSNQAVAASLLGGTVRFVARIGTDRYGEDALTMYRRYGIGTDLIFRDSTIHTGIGVILIDSRGQNLISVAPGANYKLSERDIDSAAEAFTDSCLMGFQLENRLTVVDYALRKAHAAGVTTLLDPAPAAKLPESLFPCIDYLKPNEHEAEILTGIPVRGVEDALRAGHWFLEHGVKTAIITLGEHGAVWVTQTSEGHCLPPVVEAADTTGAGDIFSGALMAAVSQGKALEESLRFASAAASISVTRLGVVESIPQLGEVQALPPELDKAA